MNNILTKTAVSAAITTTLIACGGPGAGGGVAGIGGSGYVASGSVSGFGSVFVNGIEFETSGTVFDIDDSGSGTQDDLAVGMIVTVTGSVNDDGVTGTATSISFDDQLQGPVTGITPVSDLDQDGEHRQFSVLGTTVHINLISTAFDISNDVAAAGFSFDSISDGNSVEVSGFYNPDGDLVATRVELKATTFTAGSDEVELKGDVADFADISLPFTISGATGISVDGTSAALEDLPGGLADGVSIEVKGTCADVSCSTINATRIEGQTGFDDADKISVEGIITDFVDAGNFSINGIHVDASSAALSPADLVLRDGVRVEVEGPLTDNSIQALSVELRGGNAKVYAVVSSVDAASGDFIVTVNGQTIDIDVNNTTEMEDPVTVNSFVRVRGIENDDGGVTASKVDVRDDTDDTIVQGRLESFMPDTSITILGVSFTVDYNGGAGDTEFEDETDSSINQTTFETSAPVGSLVKVKDKGDDKDPADGIADEIEIEVE